MTILLREQFGEFALSADQGRCLGEQVREALQGGEESVLDFAGIRSVISAFLNPAIGELYGAFPAEVVDDRVRVINASPVQEQSVELVRSNARRYYQDPEFRRAQDSALEELFSD